MPSISASFYYRTFKAFKLKNSIFAKVIDNPPRNSGAMSAKKFPKNLTVTERDVEGFMVLTVQPTTPTGHHVVFLHGGAYKVEGMAGHRTLMVQLVKRFGLTVSFIDYPLAPEHQATYSHEVVMKAYAQLVAAYPEDSFSLLGDSAGGGLALAFLQQLRQQSILPVPQKTVLVSPWLDIDLVHEAIPRYEPTEVILSRDTLRAAGKLYRGDLAPTDPLVSPLYGDMSGLGHILVQISTVEFFYPDSQALAEKLTAAEGSQVTLSEYPGMVHDWIVFPMPETTKAIEEIGYFLVGDD